ncbi:MAG TPA: hypothetical protein VI078_04420 [bacterium]
MPWKRVAAVAGLLVLTAGQPLPGAEPSGQVPPPQWVGAAEDRGRARLTWIRNPAFAAVRVYRRQSEAAAGFAPVGESRENSYLDATVQPGVAYAYRLAGVGRDGREGRPSTEMGFRIAPVTRRSPEPPDWEGHLVLPAGIGLKWSAREGEDVLAYNLYRRELPVGQFQLLASSKGTSYQDNAVEAGRRYAYALTALDSSFRETAFSAPLELLFAPAPPAAERRAEETWRVRRTRAVAVIAAADVPLLRPADVAVGPVTGNVYLADSGLGRVLVFSAAGGYLRSVGAGAGPDGKLLRNAIGVACDGEEHLYVADAGRSAVYVFAPGGELLRRIDIPPPEIGVATGISDVAVGAGGRLFVLDNLNNRVGALDRVGQPRFFGALGAKEGDLSAPTFCDLDAAGNLYVAEAFNARVQVFSPAGQFARHFGRYVRGPGGMGRPKGVAVDRSGEVYVADSWLNTVQVFDAAGRFVAVLADEDGVPLDLGSPNGVALGRGRLVAIAERLSARLQIREIIDGPR